MLTPLAGCETNLVTPRRAGGEVAFLSPPDLPPAQGGFYVEYGAVGAVGGWSMPHLDPEAWTLTLDGLVAAPLTLRLSDLEAEAEAAAPVLQTMRCITDSNEFPGLIGTTLWRGAPLSGLLDRAGLDRQRTRRLRIYGADGFTDNLKIEAVYGAFGPGAFEPMLVTRMNEMPLTREHGRPVRLFVPGAYGYKSVKWITRIEATDSDEVFGTYQQVLGFTDEATAHVAGKITNPVFNEVVPAGAVLVSGFAVSGFAPIARVEVAFDEGAFEAARLVPLDELTAQEPALAQARQVLDGLAFPFRAVWVKWTFRWDATPGTHRIRVRATDGAGNTQPEEDFTPEDGLNPIASVNVTVT